MRKKTFHNLPQTDTPVEAGELNEMQTWIDEDKIDKTLPSTEEDLDNLTTTGFYRIQSGSPNIPVSGYTWFLQVISYGNYVYQIAYKIVSNEMYETYQRLKYGNTWGEWKPIAIETDGTWTPTINTREDVAPTLTYNLQKGSFKKLGNMVFISFYCSGKITALNGTDNYAVVKGLPFTPKYYSIGECAISLGIISNFATVTGGILIISNAHDGEIYCQSSTGGSPLVLKTSGDNNFVIAGSGWYETA